MEGTKEGGADRGVIIGFADDDGNTRLDDTSLLGCDGRQGVAKELLVVEADVGDDGEVRVDDIGAVQTATETHFDDCHIHLLLCEI